MSTLFLYIVPLQRRLMATMANLWTKCQSQEMRPKNGEHSRTLRASSKTPLATYTGKWSPSTSRTDSDLCMRSSPSTSTLLSSPTLFARTRKSVWLSTGGGDAVRWTLTTDSWQMTVASPQTESKTTCVTLTSTRRSATSASAWSTWIGGVVTRPSASISRCARRMAFVRPRRASTMTRSVPTELPRMMNSWRLRRLASPSELAEIESLTEEMKNRRKSDHWPLFKK